MSKQRYIDTKFWDDNYIVERDPIEKLLYLYLLTNALTNILGIYEISLRRIGFDTGIDKDMVVKILGRFEIDGKIKYYNGYIAIKKFVKYQADNPKINKGIELLLKEVPVDLIKWIDIDFDRLGIKEGSLCIGLDKTSKDSNYSNPNPNNNPNNNSKKISFSFKKEKFINLPLTTMEVFEEKYPSINVYIEIEKMERWLLAEKVKKDNGEKNKIPKDYNLFIHKWLGKD